MSNLAFEVTCGNIRVTQLTDLIYSELSTLKFKTRVLLLVLRTNAEMIGYLASPRKHCVSTLFLEAKSYTLLPYRLGCYKVVRRASR
jgi:hypothetical protein